MYGFNQRTVEPFETSSHQGNHKSTSRSQTKTSLWTLDFYYSVIPNVSFIWWIILFFTRRMRSLKPTFVSVRYSYLTVKQTIYFYAQKQNILLEFTFCTSLLLFKRISPQENYPTKTVFFCSKYIKYQKNEVLALSRKVSQWRLIHKKERNLYEYYRLLSKLNNKKSFYNNCI